MEVDIVVINAADPYFEQLFEKYREQFFVIMSHSYRSYYGNDYQWNRVVDDRATIFLALVDDDLVGVSYVKQNLRRGGTAVWPEEFRRRGIAERLIIESLELFPRQYTILRVSNYPMLNLMEKMGFQRAIDPDEIAGIAPEEFTHLLDFKFVGEYLVFKRYSLKRQVVRGDLTFLHTFY